MLKHHGDPWDLHDDQADIDRTQNMIGIDSKRNKKDILASPDFVNCWDKARAQIISSVKVNQTYDPTPKQSLDIVLVFNQNFAAFIGDMFTFRF